MKSTEKQKSRGVFEEKRFGKETYERTYAWQSAEYDCGASEI